MVLFIGTRCRNLSPPLPYSAVDGAWRSLVARVLWEHEVPGSNPGAPIAAAGAARCRQVAGKTAPSRSRHAHHPPLAPPARRGARGGPRGDHPHRAAGPERRAGHRRLLRGHERRLLGRALRLRHRRRSRRHRPAQPGHGHLSGAGALRSERLLRDERVHRLARRRGRGRPSRPAPPGAPGAPDRDHGRRRHADARLVLVRADHRAPPRAAGTRATPTTAARTASPATSTWTRATTT